MKSTKQSAMVLLKRWIVIEGLRRATLLGRYEFGTPFDFYLKNHEIELTLTRWEESQHKVYHTPGTYARKWRLLKARKTFTYGGFRVDIKPVPLDESAHVLSIRKE